MTGSNRTSAGLDGQRKRLLFRAWHRGTRELDLLLGSFADRHIATLSAADLARFEALLNVPDTVLYEWVTGKTDADPEHDNPLYHALVAFHSTRDHVTVR